MKRVKYIILGLVLTLSLSACQDWLTIIPDNEKISDQFWSTKEEAEAVLVNGYVSLRNCIELMYIHGEARGKTLSTAPTVTSTSDNDVRNITRLNILPENKFASWANFYKVINMANMVIRYAPDVVGRDKTFHENMMRSWQAEAYFLRALSYFYMIRIWKDVPFITEPYMTDDEDFDKAKSTEYEITGQLLNDLYANLSVAKEFFEEPDTENQRNSKGRATRWALYALIADIHLWRGEYQQCIDACDKIMNSGWIGLIRATEEQIALNTNQELEVWFSNFNPGNTNESIFEIQFNRGANQYNDAFLTWFLNSPPRYVLSQYMLSRITADQLTDLRANLYAKGGLQVAKNYFTTTSGNSRNGGAAASGQAGNANDQNVIIYRLAEVYLMKAEALVMLGQSNNIEAVRDYINPLRTRVNAPEIDASGLGGTSELDMLKLILSEREMELLGEGKSWFDILRIAKRNNFQYRDFLMDEVLLSDAVRLEAPAILRNKLQDTFAFYMPIAKGELEINQLLEQNPYYVKW